MITTGKKAPPCPVCGGPLRRLAGRVKPSGPLAADERWICRRAMEERRDGGLGPFDHEGDTWNVSYLIRSDESHKRNADAPMPGDVIVDRALRAVYAIAEDGSRRRCKDKTAIDAAIAFVKERIKDVG